MLQRYRLPDCYARYSGTTSCQHVSCRSEMSRRTGFFLGILYHRSMVLRCIVAAMVGGEFRGRLHRGSLTAYYGRMGGIEAILAILRAHMSDFEALGVRRLGVFGSTVTGEAGPQSDLDILVAFHPGRKSFDSYMDLKFLLEDIFPARRIDLVLENALKPAIRPYIEASVRYVA